MYRGGSRIRTKKIRKDVFWPVPVQKFTFPDLLLLPSLKSTDPSLPSLKPTVSSGTKRDKLHGTNGYLRKSAVFCENLRFPAVFCENLRLPNAIIPRKSKNLRKTANSAPFVPFSLSFLFPLETDPSQLWLNKSNQFPNFKFSFSLPRAPLS